MSKRYSRHGELQFMGKVFVRNIVMKAWWSQLARRPL